MHARFTPHNSMLGFSCAGVIEYLEKENQERDQNLLKNNESKDDISKSLYENEEKESDPNEKFF
ncbi:putative transcriptional regulator [Chryseobacterium sp. JUb7]|nr:putative transcriptional regulator [Chryseobacterium sp. JUb7]